LEAAPLRGAGRDDVLRSTTGDVENKTNAAAPSTGETGLSERYVMQRLMASSRTARTFRELGRIGNRRWPVNEALTASLENAA